MAKDKVVIVDDDEFMRDSLMEALQRPDLNVVGFGRAADALDAVSDGSASVLLTDMRMPEMGGMELLLEARRLDPKLPVVMMTAFATIETAVEAMKRGAFDYVMKPFKAEELDLAINRALEQHRLITENEYLRDELAKKFRNADFVGKSPAMKAVFEEIRQAAPTSATVFIRGESGTGKELVARSIHAQSPRRAKPLVKVNCAALSAGVLESELFGHEKGAFTGADKRRIGRFEMADGGTLFLDEVSEMDLNLQGKLLRVLQEKEFERVGSSETISVDVRILASSNRELEKSIEAGEFRQDLYYRLNVISIELPPLRERKADIPALARHFLERYRQEEGARVRDISDDAMELLRRYDWPGNVRELANIMERLIVLGRADVIEAAQVENALPKNALRGLVRPSAGEAPVPADGDGDFRVRPLDDVEREFVVATLRHFDGARAKSAESLGISERSLRDRLKRWQEAGLVGEV
ncbi:MAG: sigma-54 dependent transcriptional regulator [Planctomycetota bacterium]|jgi:DNA-binding NtrC family response regulator|nr:sigma-54 dependent transcriptional regulator [Planctomycetota bacterium]